MPRFFSFILAFAAVLMVQAQKPLADAQIDSMIQSNKVVFVDGKPAPEEIQHTVDSIRKKISAFYYDQFRHFQDPGAPYFLFMSKDAALAMGIGGAVRMRAYYDWGGAIPASGMAPYLIPMQPDPCNRRHFGTTPSGTCLFFRVLGRNKTLGDYQLYIETNFNGYSGRDLHLKKAYATINDFTIGYAASTFSDPAALPPTVDAQGPSNKITPTSVLVRYMPVVKDKYRVCCKLICACCSAENFRSFNGKVFAGNKCNKVTCEARVTHVSVKSCRYHFECHRILALYKLNVVAADRSHIAGLVFCSLNNISVVLRNSFDFIAVDKNINCTIALFMRTECPHKVIFSGFFNIYLEVNGSADSARAEICKLVGDRTFYTCCTHSKIPRPSIIVRIIFDIG